jgi:hypothetical protein
MQELRLNPRMKNRRPYGQPVPTLLQYDFEAFVQKVKNLDWDEIKIRAASACASAEKASSGRGSLAAREGGSVEFARKAGDLSYFLHYGTMPASNWVDAGIYKEIAESLVAKGQWKNEALSQFKARS